MAKHAKPVSCHRTFFSAVVLITEHLSPNIVLINACRQENACSDRYAESRAQGGCYQCPRRPKTPGAYVKRLAVAASS
jgi:hypothetical protein